MKRWKITISAEQWKVSEDPEIWARARAPRGAIFYVYAPDARAARDKFGPDEVCCVCQAAGEWDEERGRLVAEEDLDRPKPTPRYATLAELKSAEVLADARAIASVIMRDLLAPLVRMNFGAQADVPTLRFVTDAATDLEQLSPAIASPAEWKRITEEAVERAIAHFVQASGHSPPTDAPTSKVRLGKGFPVEEAATRVARRARKKDPPR